MWQSSRMIVLFVASVFLPINVQGLILIQDDSIATCYRLMWHLILKCVIRVYLLYYFMRGKLEIRILKWGIYSGLLFTGCFFILSDMYWNTLKTTFTYSSYFFLGTNRMEATISRITCDLIWGLCLLTLYKTIAIIKIIERDNHYKISLKYSGVKRNEEVNRLLWMGDPKDPMLRIEVRPSGSGTTVLLLVCDVKRKR